MIEEFADLIPRCLMDESGKVFYSGRLAFESPSELYLLGFNPGGCPERYTEETVSRHTDKVLHSEPDNWSAYRDESWEGKDPGTHQMAPRVLHLFQGLEIDPREVPASNIIFKRSKNKKKLKGDWKQLAQKCWRFHQHVIEMLGVRVVLCFGQDTGYWVQKQLGVTTKVDEFIETYPRRHWKSRTCRNTEGLTVVVATHPSVADWTNPHADPTELVCRALIGV